MSAIEWTSETWNPLVGCTKVSAGCKGCYAIRQAWRNAHMPHTAERYAGTVAKTSSGLNWTGQVNLVESVLDKPLRWRKPRRVFVNSMSDLFHESVPDEWIDRVFAAMALAPQHTFQVLTKRPERLRAWFGGTSGMTREAHVLIAIGNRLRGQPMSTRIAALAAMNRRWPLPNVWLGVSVEDQATADARIPLLLETPAAVRFVSAEPLLGPVDLDPPRCDAHGIESNTATLDGLPACNDCQADGRSGELSYGHWLDDPECAVVNGPAIGWVIVGGESGPGARPCDVEWIRSIVRQCRDAGVPAFVKQLGSWAYDSRFMSPATRHAANCATGIHNRKGGDPAEWPADLRVREFPSSVVPQKERP